jgi:hypothetical protein
VFPTAGSTGFAQDLDELWRATALAFGVIPTRTRAADAGTARCALHATGPRRCNALWPGGT